MTLMRRHTPVRKWAVCRYRVSPLISFCSFRYLCIPPRFPEQHRAVCSGHRLHRTYVTAVQGYLTVFDRLCLVELDGMPRLTEMTDRWKACWDQQSFRQYMHSYSILYAFVVMSKRTRAELYSVIDRRFEERNPKVHYGKSKTDKTHKQIKSFLTRRPGRGR